MNNDKILIVGSKTIDKFEIAKCLTKLNEELSIAPVFTSDIKYKDIQADATLNLYYKDNENINLDYKNNALFYITSSPEVSYGITIEDFYNNNICILNIADFNSISDKNLKLCEPLIIAWIDTKYNKDNIVEFKETKFLMERLCKFKYLYFLNEDLLTIAHTIINYINGSEKDKEKIIEEYS